MSARATISDVAREAGVSLMTVSRVVNGKGEISPATRQRVLDVIERLGYRPSGIARGIATQRTGTLGIVVPDMANPFFSDVARGAEDRARAAGYNVFVCNTDESPQREIEALDSLEEKRVDGLVLCSSRLHDEGLRAALDHHTAAVLINRRMATYHVDAVLLADKEGATIATQHLLRTGHRAIGFLSGPVASFSSRQRTEGYRAALAEEGLPINPAWSRSCSYEVEGGRETTHLLVKEHPELTAIFCYNDLVAVGALQACAEMGRRVPEDIALVGFDDIPIAALVTPPLTTVRVPRYDMGDHAMRLLLKRVEGLSEAHEQIVLHPDSPGQRSVGFRAR